MTLSFDHSMRPADTNVPQNNLLDFLIDLRSNGQLEQALKHWKYLLTIVPPLTGINAFLSHVSLLLLEHGIRLSEQNQFDEALIYYNYAAQASDVHVLSTLNNAAICLSELGALDESIAAYQNALRINPNYQKAHDGLLLSLHYKPGLAPSELATAHRAWDEKFGIPPHKLPQHYTNNPQPEKVLQIGIISGDLWKHSVAVFLVRFLENIDRTKFSFRCYSIHSYKDAMSDRIQKAVAHWDDVENLSDDQLTQKIQADGIDILIDLGGHTGKNRLTVFARKPAPIQIGWMGYPGCNGLSAMDYVIGDRFVLPHEMQPHARAKILHLPDSFVCFDPLPLAPPISALPAQTPGQITFGYFNNPIKCNEQVIKLWAGILHRLPQAKLLLKYRGFGVPAAQKKFAAQFAAHGVDPSRLEFQGASPISKMFAAMSSVDLALDPFPFTGGMMTCLTLWMGVPVLTMPGNSFASRQGLSFLSSIGITDTIAENAQDYFDKAVALAHDLDRLADIRNRLRPAMEASPLCDGVKAAAGLQDLLRKVWRDWCRR